MREQHEGVILNIASVNAVVLGVPRRMTAYSSSKAGLVQMSKTLAVEYLFDGIRVNAIIMGGVETPQAVRSQDSFAQRLRGPDYERPLEPGPWTPCCSSNPGTSGRCSHCCARTMPGSSREPRSALTGR